MDPPTLLSLPREIRDQIWSYVLISPTGFMRPKMQKAFLPSQSQLSPSPSPSPSRSTNYPRYLLSHYSPSENTNRSSLKPVISPSTRPKRDKATTSLSIIHTNRQIYAETHDLFWNNATFYFTPDATQSIFRFLKGIGQTASRHIQSVTIAMPSLQHTSEFLPRALKSFNSRARHGKLKNLDLVWGQSEFKELFRGSGQSTGAVWLPKDGERVMDILSALKGDGRWGFERSIRLPAMAFTIRHSNLVEDLHVSFGGRLFVGDKLVWQDFNRMPQV